MRISTRAPICDLDGTQIAHSNTKRPATFASIAIAALAQRTQFDIEVEELGLLAFMLCKRLHNNEFVEVTADEAADIRRRVLLHPQFNNTVVGRMCEMLDEAAARAIQSADAPTDLDASQNNVTPLRKE